MGLNAPLFFFLLLKEVFLRAFVGFFCWSGMLFLLVVGVTRVKDEDSAVSITP